MKKLTHAAFVAALLVATTFINAPPAAADQLFNGRLISEGPRIYLALQPKGDRECERLNSDAMIQNRAAALNQRIFAEVFIPKRAGYVYWLSYPDGPHEVIYTSYTIINCVVVETTEERRAFERFNDAREDYNQTVKRLLE